jgi:hypothetical protein
MSNDARRHVLRKLMLLLIAKSANKTATSFCGLKEMQ